MKRILFSLMAVVLSVGLIGSAFAYFSDTETSVNNSFTAGTLDLQLSNAGTASTWANGVTDTWVSPLNWAPGDPEVSAWLYMKNSGTTGADIVKVGGVTGSIVEQNNGTTDAEGKLPPNDNIADYIELTSIHFTELEVDPWGNLIGAYVSLFDSDSNGWVSLREFVDSQYALAFWIGDFPLTQEYIPPLSGRIERVMLGFTFRSDAGNEYQSDTAGFTIKVVATDDTSGITVLGSGGYAEK